jgi:branched-chain amino acid aminotransferase
VYGDRIVTPELTGSLLPGITRDSLLTIARDLGYVAEEGRISTEDWRRDTENGTLTEVFACGTAAVITPVGTVKSRTAEWIQGDGTPGPVTMKLRGALLSLQTGAAPDPYGWMHDLG